MNYYLNDDNVTVVNTVTICDLIQLIIKFIATMVFIIHHYLRVNDIFVLNLNYDEDYLNETFRYYYNEKFDSEIRLLRCFLAKIECLLLLIYLPKIFYYLLFILKACFFELCLFLILLLI